MPRQRDPRRDEAFEIWKKHNGEITNREIAGRLDVPEKTISAWKSRDKWNAVLQKGERSTAKAKSKKSNRKGIGNPHPVKQFTKRNSAAVKHGFFRTIFPDDEETHSIIGAIGVKSPIDMLWENIVIQYTAIARAQKIMFVRDQEDITRELKKTMESADMTVEEYEIQFAWDKQSTFLQAQSRAMSTLQSLIRQYEDMVRAGKADEEQELRLQKLKLEVRNLSGESDQDAHQQNSNYVEALNGQVEDIFDDEDEDDA